MHEMTAALPGVGDREFPSNAVSESQYNWEQTALPQAPEVTFLSPRRYDPESSRVTVDTFWARHTQKE